MDLLRILLPYWRTEYWTDLNYDQIGYVLLENVVSGPSLYSRKAYYGTFAPQGFSVRRPWSRMKKMSFSPTVKGTYGVHKGRMTVTLGVTPHAVFLGIFALFASQGVFVGLHSVSEFFRTWDLQLLTGSLFPMAVVFGIPWLIFRTQCRTDVLFWEQALRLRKVPG